MKAIIISFEDSEVEIKTLIVNANVRYWEGAEIILNGERISNESGDHVPCKQGDLWCPVIDVDTGTITNWEHGKSAKIHFKVCDEGVYHLVSESGDIVATKSGYVPDMMCPKENGYGDYIIMDIDCFGKIENWEFTSEGFDNDY